MTALLVSDDRRCAGRNIVANRPAPETDLSADFTYVDGYDGPAISQPIDVRSSQTKLFSLFRSKKSAEPTSVQPMQTTITAGAYSGPKVPHQSSVRRQDYPPYHQDVPCQQNVPYAQNVPTLLVTAPSRPDTADFTDAEWVTGDSRLQNPGHRQSPWTVDHHSQPTYGRGAGGFVANGSQDRTPSHQQNTDFGAFQPQSYSAVQNALPYAGSNGWSSAMQREGSPRRSPHLGGPQRSFDDHWSAYGESAAPAESASWERRKSLPSIVKLPAAPTPQPKQRASNVRNTSSVAQQHRPQVETYVIENGVRKRVRYVRKKQPFRTRAGKNLGFKEIFLGF